MLLSCRCLSRVQTELSHTYLVPEDPCLTLWVSYYDLYFMDDELDIQRDEGQGWIDGSQITERVH